MGDGMVPKNQFTTWFGHLSLLDDARRALPEEGVGHVQRDS